MGNKRKRETDVGEKKEVVRKGKEKETPCVPGASAERKPEPNRRPHMRKLAPPRPHPTVSSASSATGPRSAHREGKNNICITRKTKLAAYLNRCKALLVDGGFKELRLSAMGAAIPHLALLTVSLPPLLPWGKEEVHVDVLTGSLEVHDEMLSESGSEDEGGPKEEFRTRVKSTMNVVIRVGEGKTLSTTDNHGPLHASKKVERRAGGGKGGERQGGGEPDQIVLQEPEQDGMETS